MGDYYTQEEVDRMLADLRAEMIQYMNKQIILGKIAPSALETSLFLEDVTPEEEP